MAWPATTAVHCQLVSVTAAIGERLRRLGATRQILAVSPRLLSATEIHATARQLADQLLMGGGVVMLP
jgi:hypothetical protein